MKRRKPGAATERLSHAKLNDIWRAGYCRTTVLQARDTTPAEAQKRLDFLTAHIGEARHPQCLECFFANKLKQLEAVVAQQIGAYAAFCRGEDVMGRPGAHEALARVLRVARASGVIPAEMEQWMARIATRTDYEQDHT
jgi:hypothetical protein